MGNLQRVRHMADKPKEKEKGINMMEVLEAAKGPVGKMSGVQSVGLADIHGLEHLYVEISEKAPAGAVARKLRSMRKSYGKFPFAIKRKGDKKEEIIDSGIPEPKEKEKEKEKKGDFEIIILEPPPSGGCEFCGEQDELRPYGPNGEWVCFDCAMLDEEAAGEKFMEMFSAHKGGSMNRRAADWKVEMYVGDRVVGTFSLENIVDERAGVDFIIQEHLDWEVFPLGSGRYRVQISADGSNIGEWEIEGDDQDDAVFNAIDRFIDWDFMEVEKVEGKARQIRVLLATGKTGKAGDPV